MISRSASSRATFPAPSELRRLLDANYPSTVLRELSGDIPPEASIFKAEALLELDRLKEALDCIDSPVKKLEGEQLADAERLRSVILLRAGRVDDSILSAIHATGISKDTELKATTLAWSAVGYASKNCWNLAETSLREAIEMAPNAPRLLMAQARVRLEADQRIQAREIYERMREHDSGWAQVYGTWGCSYVAYLLGEFDQAVALAEEALQNSDEMITPLFVMGQVALAREDILGLEKVIVTLNERSPNAESLDYWQEEFANLRLRKENSGRGVRKRLEAFPTLVQRKDYCGPSTVELLMRYWKGVTEFSSEQIAERVKIPQSGTPIYRMREFFHLAGFDTVRTLAPVEKLKMLIEAGFPVIVQEEFSNSSHVAVVIGYDDEMGCVELQDPMTHVVTRTPFEEFNRLRRTYLDAALIAFPHGRGLERLLARMGIYDNLALVWCDQAVLELDQYRFQAAVKLASKAVKKEPALCLGWVLLCHAQLENWRITKVQKKASESRVGTKIASLGDEPPFEARRSFYKSLSEAKAYHPEQDFIFQFEGNGALLEHNLSVAMAAFERAVDADEQDARNHASLAECYYAKREFQKAYQAASQALEHDPSLPAANAWMARVLASLDGKNAEYYARMAVDLSPDWWIPHLALSEALLRQGQLPGARREVELALSLAPGQSEVRVLRGVILTKLNQLLEAADELQSVLEDGQSLDNSTLYLAYQTLAHIAFGGGLFDETIEYTRHMLDLAPGDPWGLQFQVAARCQKWVQERESLDIVQIEELQQAYEEAIQANYGEVGIIRDYLSCLESVAGITACIQAIERLRRVYPENNNLLYWEGSLQVKAGDKEAATQLLLKALSKPEGVMNQDELFDAVKIILETLGLDLTEKAIIESGIPEGGVSLVERQRALGLALAIYPETYAERARELLLFALSANVDDALVMLRLGDISQLEEDRELCYRRALALAPGWDYARANLANYLNEQGREMEAWELTTGYEHESLELMTAHGRALLGMGHFEEARATFEQAIERSELEEPRLTIGLWQAQMRSGMIKAALKTARKGLRLFEEDIKWYVRVATTYRELGRYDEARRVLERGVRNGLSDEEVLKANYEITWVQKDYVLAQQILEHLLSISEEKTSIGKLGWVKSRYLHLLVMVGNFEETRQFLLQENLSAEGWGEAAWSILLSDESELTIELAERALALDPEQYNGLFARAEALSRLDREEEALAAIYKLLDVYPEEHNAYEKLAIRLAVAGDLDRAFEYADRCVELGLFCPYAWATRGFVHFLCGRLEEAQEDLRDGWNRADQQRRERQTYFWWILAALQGEEILAEQYRNEAYRETRNELERRIVALTEAMLAD